MRACNSIPYSYRSLFIGWMVDSEFRDTGLHDLGRRFTSRRRKDVVGETAKKVLDVVLGALEKHLKV